MQLSESSASDLSISLTQSELEEDLPESEAHERNASSGETDDHNQHSPESSIHSNGSKNTPQLNCESSAPVVTLERYSIYDFCTLLCRNWKSASMDKNTNILIALWHMLFLKHAQFSQHLFPRFKAQQTEKGENALHSHAEPQRAVDDRSG